MTKLITVLTAAALLAGCATGPTGASYAPLVDMRGVDATRQAQDQYECQQYAQQRAGAADGAVAGAVAGALIGVVLAAIVGGGIRNEMAGIGAVTGGLQGAAAGEGTQRDIIRRCMSGRGYNVLN